MEELIRSLKLISMKRGLIIFWLLKTMAWELHLKIKNRFLNNSIVSEISKSRKQQDLVWG